MNNNLWQDYAASSIAADTSSIEQSKVDKKLAELQRNKDLKLSNLTSNGSGYKATKLLGMSDADTLITSEGTIRESLPIGAGRYDASEIDHEDKGFLSNLLHVGKSDTAEISQKEQAAKYLNKDFYEVTDQDVRDFGNMQQVQKLADLTRNSNEDRWIAPFIPNSEKVDLTDLGNGIDIGIAAQPNKDAFDRTLAETYNVNTGENVTESTASQGKLNAFAEENDRYVLDANNNIVDTKPHRDILNMSFGGRIANTVKAIGATAAKPFVGTADLVMEQFGKDLGTDEELTKSVNEFFNYNDKAMQGLATSAKTKIQEMNKDGWSFGGVIDVLKEAAKTPELFGETAGFMLSMVAGGPAGAVTKAANAAKTANEGLIAARAINDVVAIAKHTDDLAAAKKIISDAGALKRGFEFGRRNLGLTANTLSMSSADIDAYAKEANIPVDEVSVEKKLGIGVMNLALNKLDYMVDKGLIFNPTVKEALIDISKGASNKQREQLLKGLGKALYAGTVGAGIEGGTEVVQEIMTQVNQQMGEATGKDVSDVLSNSENQVDWGVSGILGAAGAHQLQGASVVTSGLKSGTDKVKSTISNATGPDTAEARQARDIVDQQPSVTLDEMSDEDRESVVANAKPLYEQAKEVRAASEEGSADADMADDNLINSGLALLKSGSKDIDEDTKENYDNAINARANKILSAISEYNKLNAEETLENREAAAENIISSWLYERGLREEAIADISEILYDKFVANNELGLGSKNMDSYLDQLIATTSGAEIPDFDMSNIEIPNIDSIPRSSNKESSDNSLDALIEAYKDTDIEVPDVSNISIPEVPNMQVPSDKDIANIPSAITENEVKDSVNAKIKQAKKAKSDPLIDDSVEGTDRQDETFTYGVSRKSLDRFAKLFGITNEKIKNTIGLWIGDPQIRKMKQVSKDSDKVQRDIWFNEKTGVIPSAIQYKKAIENADEDSAIKAIRNLQRIAEDLQPRLKRMAFTREEVVTDVVEALKSDNPSEALKNVQSRTHSGTKLTFTAADVAYDLLKAREAGSVIATRKLDGVDADITVESLGLIPGKVSSIHKAKLEVYQQVTSFLRANGIGFKQTRQVVKDVGTELKIAKSNLDTVIRDLDEAEKELDAVVEFNLEAEEKDRKPQTALKNKVTALEKNKKTLEERVNWLKDKARKGEYKFLSKQEQEFVEGKKAEEVIKKTAGQEMDSVNKKQAEILKEQGIEIPKDRIKKIEKKETSSEINESVEKLVQAKKDLKKVSSITVEATNKVEEAAKKYDEELAKADITSSTQVVLDGVEFSFDSMENTLAKLYAKLNAVNNKTSVVKKQLKEVMTAQKETADARYATMAFVEDDKALKSLNKKYWNGTASIKDYSTLAKKVRSAAIKAGELLGVAISRVKKILRVDGLSAEQLQNNLDNLVTDKARIEAKIKEVEDQFRQAVAGIQKTDGKVVGIRQATKVVTAHKNLLTSITRLKKLQNKAEVNKTKLNNKIEEIENKLFSSIQTKKAISNSIGVRYRNLEIVEKIDNKENTRPADLSALFKYKNTLLGAVDPSTLVDIVEDDEAKTLMVKVLGEAKQTLENILSGDTATDENSRIKFTITKSPAASIVFESIDSKGNVKVNEHVAKVIALVASNYIATDVQGLIFNSDDDIARMRDKLEASQVTSGERRLLSKGKFRKLAAFSMGDAILAELGIKPGKVSDELYSKFRQDIGQMGLLYVQEKGFIRSLATSKISKEDWEAGTKDKFESSGDGIPMVYAAPMTEDRKKDIQQYKHMVKVLDKSFNFATTRKTYHEKSSWYKGKKYSPRDSLWDAPKESQEVLSVLEQQEFNASVGALKRLTDIATNSTDELKTMLGYKDIEKMKESGKYLLSEIEGQEGKNQEIDNSLEGLLELYDSIRSGEMNNTMFFDWFFAKNGRYMLDSVVLNPQTDKKLARWLVLPSDNIDNEWDMNNKADKLYFYTAIAQAFGLGIDKASTAEEILPFAQAILDAGEDTMKEILNPKSKHFDKNGHFIIPGTKFKAEAEHLGHTLLALEAMTKYKKDAKFKASIVAEYDAVTSGFMIKLMQVALMSDIEFNDDGTVNKESVKKNREIVEKWARRGAIIMDPALIKKLNDPKASLGINDLLSGKLNDENETFTDSYQTLAVDTDKIKEQITMVSPDEYTGKLKEATLDIAAHVNKVISLENEIKVATDSDKDTSALKERLEDLKNSEPVSPTLDAFGLWGALEEANSIKDIVDKTTNKVTKYGRNLFKPAFMIFNYAGSIKNIRKVMADSMADELLSDILNSSSDKKWNKFRTALGSLKIDKNIYLKIDTQEGWDALVDMLRTKDLDNIKVKPAVAVKVESSTGELKPIKTDIMLKKVISDTFNSVYGQSTHKALNKQFSTMIKVNDALKQGTQIMFHAFKIQFDKEMELLGEDPTQEQITETIKKLDNMFPLIRAPWSKNRADGISVVDSKKVDAKNTYWNAAQTYVKKGNQKTITVQSMKREMVAAVAAGAVLPIHWLDGSIIGKVLKTGGVLGIHDAIVLGKSAMTKIKLMNETMASLGSSYNVMDELQRSVIESLKALEEKNGLDENTLYTITKALNGKIEATDNNFNANILTEQLSNILSMSEQARIAREDLYSREMLVGNIAGPSGSFAHYIPNSKEISGKLQSKLDKAIANIVEKGCK